MAKKKKSGKKRVLKTPQKLLAKRRRAVVHKEGHAVVYEQPTAAGYDVEMVHDFFDQLLLEVRIQMHENMLVLKKLKATSDYDAALAEGRTSEKSISEQFVKYMGKYASVLIAANGFDSKNATADECKRVLAMVLEWNVKRREEQARLLESLQSLFDEAFICAKVPYGPRKGDVNPVQPVQDWNVRRIIDSGVKSIDEADGNITIR